MTNSNASLLPKNAPWVVLKFGGTSVSRRSRWDTIVKIARDWRDQGRRVVIVVSALSGITDALKGVIDAHSDDELCLRRCSDIVERHYAMFSELSLVERTALDGWLAKLKSLIESPERARAPLHWQAQVLACGELLSSTLGVAYLLSQNLDTQWLDARTYLAAQPMPNQNAWGRYLSASVPTALDEKLRATLAAQGDVFITQGFIARNSSGETVILSRGGSDTSAAYFGALLHAECVEIWTDVAGMFSANPRQVPNARLLSRLDYEEAQEIATTGAKVLHPRCINPLREANVPLQIKDTNRPELAGTRVEAAPAHAAPSIKAISSRAGITLIAMESIGMWQQVGFLADVFEHFKRHGLSIDLISSAETNVTVSLDPSENLVNSDVLNALCADLAKVCRVKVIAPCAAVTLVGRGMRAMLHKLSGVLAEFSSLRVHLITQSSNNLNLTFVVDEDVASTLLPRLHDLLIKAEALRVEDAALFGPSWRELYTDRANQAAVNPWWRKKQTALLAIAQESTPRYVYDLETVRERAQALRAMTAVDVWFYALKANNHPQILRELVAQGFGLECVSPQEVAAARDAAPNARLLFTPNFAPREEYAWAVAERVPITLDNLHPLLQWGETFRDHEVLLRIDLGVGRGHHDKVKTGGVQSKFGLVLDELPEFRRLAAHHGVRITALHAHLGSGILDSSHWKEVYMQLANLAEQFPDVVALNIGGGLGVPSRADEAPLDLATVAQTLTDVKQAYPKFELWLEPGRYLVAEAGVLLGRVTQVKSKGEVRYIGTDAGMNSLIRPALYGAYHDIVNLSRLSAAANGVYQIVGPICETSDVLGSNRRLPETHEGDVLLIAQAGAYGAVMASRYNLREPAQEVVL